MVRIAVVSSLLIAAQAGKLAITWSDCGAKHAKVTALHPSTVKTGATETLTGTGTVDETVTSAHFTATVKAAGATLASCSGDGTSDITCKLPLGAGAITVKAVPFPMSGTVTLPVTVETSSYVPASLANVDVHVAAVDQHGDSVICLDVHTAKAMELEEATQDECMDTMQKGCGSFAGKQIPCYECVEKNSIVTPYCEKTNCPCMTNFCEGRQNGFNATVSTAAVAEASAPHVEAVVATQDECMDTMQKGCGSFAGKQIPCYECVEKNSIVTPYCEKTNCPCMTNFCEGAKTFTV